MADTTANKVTDLLKDTYRAVDSGQLLKDLLERWGGTQQFARDVVGEFNASKKNGMVRQKLMEMITKLVVTNTVHQITKSERPEDLDTEEIEARLQALIGRVVNHVEVKEDAPQKRTVIDPRQEEDDSPTDFC
jgi:hypothetical protein